MAFSAIPNLGTSEDTDFYCYRLSTLPNADCKPLCVAGITLRRPNEQEDLQTLRASLFCKVCDKLLPKQPDEAGNASHAQVCLESCNTTELAWISDSDSLCTICLDLLRKSDSKVGVAKNCFHSFHLNCLATWLYGPLSDNITFEAHHGQTIQSVISVNDTCPLCRKECKGIFCSKYPLQTEEQKMFYVDDVEEINTLLWKNSCKSCRNVYHLKAYD